MSKDLSSVICFQVGERIKVVHKPTRLIKPFSKERVFIFEVKPNGELQSLPQSEHENCTKTVKGEALFKVESTEPPAIRLYSVLPKGDVQQFWEQKQIAPSLAFIDLIQIPRALAFVLACLFMWFIYTYVANILSSGGGLNSFFSIGSIFDNPYLLSIFFPIVLLIATISFFGKKDQEQPVKLTMFLIIAIVSIVILVFVFKLFIVLAPILLLVVVLIFILAKTRVNNNHKENIKSLRIKELQELQRLKDINNISERFLHQALDLYLRQLLEGSKKEDVIDVIDVEPTETNLLLSESSNWEETKQLPPSDKVSSDTIDGNGETNSESWNKRFRKIIDTCEKTNENLEKANNEAGKFTENVDKWKKSVDLVIPFVFKFLAPLAKLLGLSI